MMASARYYWVFAIVLVALGLISGIQWGRTCRNIARSLRAKHAHAWALRRNYRANNQKRPRNTAVNTERGTLRNFGARSGRPETFGDDYWGIPWHGREICSLGAPVSTVKCGASML